MRGEGVRDSRGPPLPTPGDVLSHVIAVAGDDGCGVATVGCRAALCVMETAVCRAGLALSYVIVLMPTEGCVHICSLIREIGLLRWLHVQF